MDNILFLEQFSNISGGQKVLLQIIDNLDKSKYCPIVAIPAKGMLSNELDKRKVKWFILPLGRYSSGQKNITELFNYLFRLPSLILTTKNIISTQKIDLLYANSPRTFVFAGIAGKLSNVPVVWHLHSILSGINLFITKLFGIFLLDTIITVSKSTANPLINNILSLKNKTVVIYNGIDTNKYEKQYDKASIQNELSIDKDKIIIGFIGQIAKWKGIDTFITAAKELIKHNNNCVFIIAGDSLFGNDAAKAKMIKDISGIPQIKYLGPRNDIPKILSILDIFVLPSILPDPCPLVLLEAMASGKAIIASNHGGAAEIITDNENGLLFKHGAPCELAKKILFLFDNPETSRKLGNNALKIQKMYYNNERFGNEINSEILNALNTSKNTND